jgi:hypothetical protein
MESDTSPYSSFGTMNSSGSELCGDSLEPSASVDSEEPLRANELSDPDSSQT